MTATLQWHVFRRREDAERFAPTIRLRPGQRLIAAHIRDNLDPLWWAGVHVDDLRRAGVAGWAC